MAMKPDLALMIALATMLMVVSYFVGYDDGTSGVKSAMHGEFSQKLGEINHTQDGRFRELRP